MRRPGLQKWLGRWLDLARENRKTVTTAVIISLLAGVPLTFAVLHQGFPVTDVNLTARDVWVTNAKELLAGRLNRQIEELNGSVQASSNTFDVFQDGEDAFIYDESVGSIDRVDSAFTTLGQRLDVPVGSELAYAGDTIAVMSPGKGKVWTINASGELSGSPTKSRPVMTLGKGGHIAVSAEGTVFGTSPGKKKIYTLDEPGSKTRSNDLPQFGVHQLAAVGETAVILEPKAGQLILGDGKVVALPGKPLKLQQSGADNDFAVVATGDALLEAPLGGGEARRIPADIDRPLTDPKDVSSPVWLKGCAHGAWAGAQRYLAACDDKDPKTQDIQQATKGSVLEFRVNRDVIALNNLSNGNAWLVDANMQLVENWEEVTPPQEVDSEDGEEKASQQSFEDTLAQRTPENRPPFARDDTYGVRPEKTTVLPVLDNDTDPDGDVLTVSNPSGFSASQGTLDTIDGGRALQFTPAPDFSGTATFRYTAADGRGAVAEATVNVTVRPPELNLAPVSHRAGAVSVEQGHIISYNVLADWIDPDGDDIYLVSAAPTTGDSVRFGPEGFVTFESKTSELGPKEVTFVVSDGTATATATLTVDVKPTGTLKPIGTPDFASTFVGEPVLVEPLVNDVTPSGAPLTLIGVQEVPDGVSAVPNLERGTLTVSAPEPGSYVFTYTLGAGATSSVGLIRVDVKEKPKAAQPPIAVKDTAYLRAGEPVSVSVLANDVSPNGDVLAVQSVDTGVSGDLVSVEILTNTVLRITASSALTKQIEFSYTISDGTTSSTAGVTIVPVPPLIKHQPPVAVDDTVNVRAGDVVSVPVLDNDFHPDSATMTVAPELASVENSGGLAFVTGDLVRYQAPDVAGSYSVAYTTTDGFAETATAVVHFTVVGPDQKGNRPPAPLPLTMRTFADSTIKVKVPLDGLDPDGDSVFLTDVTTAPKLGRIVDQGSDYFVYEAFPGKSGTDTFVYEVEDTGRATKKGTVRIGVVPRPEKMLPPNAVDDSIEIKPGTTGSIPVVLNDSDPNGYKLRLSKKLPEVDEGLKTSVNGARIVVETPEEVGTYTLRYEITNGKGGADTAFVQVKVTPDAKPQYPKAVDHFIEPKEAFEKDSVTVDVLKDAENPSGLIDDLEISLEGPNAKSADIHSGGKVRVTPKEDRQAIAYRLTNKADTLSATAFIIVPAKSDGDKSKSEQPPFLKPMPEQLVKMNGSKSWPLDDILEVPSGRPAKILSATATNSDGSPVNVDPKTLTFTAAKDYRGPASVTFVVTDGKDADDKKANEATLTIPVTVGDPNFEDVAPTFTPPNVTIEAGEPAVITDLRSSSGHPNPEIIQKLGYGAFSGSTASVNGALDGSSLSISAPRGTPTGTKATLKFSMTYKEFTIPGSVQVTVVASTRALPQAVDDCGPNCAGIETKAGNTANVAVLDNDYNPFAASGEPLKVVSAAIEQDVPGGTASISFTSSGVSIRTGPSATGTLSAVYRIQDATGDKSREVQGRITLVIRNVPDAPNRPVAAPGDGSATVSFAAPASNNSPITGYTISWAGGTLNVADAGNYTIPNLNNGTSYTFRVVAHNAIGPSTASPASNAVTPFGVPGAPASANLDAATNGSGDLSLNWGAPASTNGSGVTSYKYAFIEGSSGSATTGGRMASANGSNGTQYRYHVQACNARGCGAFKTSNAATPTAPARSATTKRGPAHSEGGCATGCYLVAFDYAGFTPGSYVVTPEYRDAGTSGWRTLSSPDKSLSTSGSMNTNGFLGTAGEHDEVRVHIVGQGIDFYSSISGAWG